MTNMAHSSIKSNWNAYRYFKIGRNAAIRNRADWSTLGKKNRRSFVTGPHTNTPTEEFRRRKKKNVELHSLSEFGGFLIFLDTISFGVN